MAVKIRLARGGAKKSPYYRIVVANADAPRDGAFLENVGTYNPLSKSDELKVTLKTERVEHWMNNGAKPTERVAKFIEKAGITLPSAVKKSMDVKAKAQTHKAPKKQKAE